MLRNYFKIAWRNILRNKGIFSINIAGLAIGIASCLLIMVFVLDELSYDRFNEKADEIVRVVFKANINGEEMKEAVVMAPVAAALKEELPEVIDATRIRRIGTPKITSEDKSFRDSRFAYVDPNFFKVFTLPVAKGNSENPLEEPNTAVITETEAKKLFGNKDAIGKTITLQEQGKDFKITAIIKDIPKNSHFHFDILASTEGFLPAQGTSWVNSDFYTYLLLKDGTDYKAVESKLPAIVEKYMGPQMKDAIGMTFADFKKDNDIGLFLQPLTDIHLKSDFTSSTTIEPGGDIRYVYIFSIVALFMLVIACINFMNLTTAAASKRAREIGIRKVLGSGKSQLIFQFLSESFIAAVIATSLSLILFELSLPLFNNLSGKELSIDFLFQPYILISLLLLVFIISFLAGGYPAFFLSSFKPIAALQNKFTSAGTSKIIRSSLVVFQFVISAGLIFSTLVVNQQLSFIQSKDLGYDKEQLLVLRESYLLQNNQQAFKNEILQDPRVENVSTSAFIPAGLTDNDMSGIYLGEEYQRRMFVYNIDDQYIPTMGMELITGRNFSKEYGSDSTSVIINQSAAKALGLEKDPIGKTINRDTNQGKESLAVIGVVKDFNFKPLHQKVEPLIMLNRPYGGLIIRAKVANMQGLIQDLNKKWTNYQVKEPFTYAILDEVYNETYLTERKMGSILSIFALLTILVACLGLFGLVTYTAEQRFKEIGIRKVLGSSVSGIVALLSKDFLKLILLSFLIAFPLSHYLMEQWLQDFAYRISIDWWIFALAGSITLIIALLTISYESIKAATANPIESLKTE